ncbi:hypothetical protein BJL95_03110 [Methylomonas sp. LWB]|nr:hypothetical protein BJL95_03110 [Methylomonas sp. LWB]
MSQFLVVGRDSFQELVYGYREPKSVFLNQKHLKRQATRKDVEHILFQILLLSKKAQFVEVVSPEFRKIDFDVKFLNSH